MQTIKQYCKWLQPPPDNALELIEYAGRISYKSEDRISPGSASEFVKRILTQQHESVIEHVSASVLFVTDRGVSHEIVRHRIASYTQESTRYCNYSKGRYNGDLTFILPVRFYRLQGLSEDQLLVDPMSERYLIWITAMNHAELRYMDDMAQGATAQEARDVLPNSLKTEIAMTANLREWRHFFKLRTHQSAHPQMRELAMQAQAMFHERLPELF